MVKRGHVFKGAHAWQGGVCGRKACMAREMATAADATHPTDLVAVLVFLPLAGKVMYHSSYNGCHLPYSGYKTSPVTIGKISRS